MVALQKSCIVGPKGNLLDPCPGFRPAARMASRVGLVVESTVRPTCYRLVLSSSLQGAFGPLCLATESCRLTVASHSPPGPPNAQSATGQRLDKWITRRSLRSQRAIRLNHAQRCAWAWLSVKVGGGLAAPQTPRNGLLEGCPSAMACPTSSSLAEGCQQADAQRLGVAVPKGNPVGSRPGFRPDARLRP